MRKFNIKELLNNRKTLYFTLGIILVSVLSLTIVYAALSVTLNITGSSEITASNWDIHLENVKVKSGSVSGNAPSISGDNLSFSANLTKPGEFYEFTVDVVNDGTIDAMIDSVVKTPELTSEQAKYIKYEVSYANGESINTKQTIKSKTKTPIKVRIEYRNDLSASDLPATTTNLSLKLTLIYVQSDGSGSSVKDNGELKLINVVSGSGTNTSDEVCIGEECFYVMYSDDTSITMLAKYNLYVGGEYNSGWTAYGDEATGKQDLNMIGFSFKGKPFKGITKFSNTNYWSSTISSYPAYVYDSNSTLYSYVENYKTYLSTLGVTPSVARLITYEELTSFGCSEDDYICYGAPSWVYATSYWSGSAFDTYDVWHVDSYTYFDYNSYSYGSHYGCRPVIVIDRNLIDGTGSSATKQLIEFTIDDITYQAEEGMTWEEWCGSEFNINSFITQNKSISISGCEFLFNSTENKEALSSEVIGNGLNYVISRSGCSGGGE